MSVAARLCWNSGKNGLVGEYERLYSDGDYD